MNITSVSAQPATPVQPIRAAEPDSANTATPVNVPQLERTSTPARTNFHANRFDGLRLIPIDPGFEDVSLLANSPKQLPVDLRLPLNFDRVYRIEGDLSRLGLSGANPTWSAHANTPMYARASGGLIAIFPQSKYVATKRGMRPVVPANTTFFIGTIPQDAVVQPGIDAINFANDRSPNDQAVNPNSVANSQTVAAAAQRNDLRADLRANPLSAENSSRALDISRVTREPGPAGGSTRRATPTIWTSEPLRASRLGALLRLTHKPDPNLHPNQRPIQRTFTVPVADSDRDDSTDTHPEQDHGEPDQDEARRLTPASSP